jgi:hypothetical protein
LKVRKLTVSRSIARGLTVVSIATALAAGAAAAPLAALAQSAPSPVTPVVSVEASVASLVSSESSATPVIVATVTAPVPVAAKKPTVPALIAQVGHASGLSTAQVNALLWIAKHESNYHPTSKSSSRCYGLFQLSAGMAAGHPWKDATWNTKRAIKYMKGRYGGPVQAEAFWKRHHWY